MEASGGTQCSALPRDTLTHGDLLMFWLVDDCSTTLITAAHGIIIAYFTVSKFMFVRSGVIYGLDTDKKMRPSLSVSFGGVTFTLYINNI